MNVSDKVWSLILGVFIGVGALCWGCSLLNDPDRVKVLVATVVSWFTLFFVYFGLGLSKTDDR